MRLFLLNNIFNVNIIKGADMRKLKVKLADDQVYTFSTLTLTEQNIVKKLTKISSENEKELDSLTEKNDSGKLTSEEQNKFEELQDRSMNNLLQILVISLSKAHPEFKAVEGDGEKVLNKLKDILDLRDVKRFVSFCMLGALPVEEEKIQTEIVEIDLT